MNDTNTLRENEFVLPPSLKHDLAKISIATVGGWVVGKLVNVAYDAARIKLAERQVSNTETPAQ